MQKAGFVPTLKDNFNEEVDLLSRIEKRIRCKIVMKKAVYKVKKEIFGSSKESFIKVWKVGSFYVLLYSFSFINWS